MVTFKKRKGKKSILTNTCTTTALKKTYKKCFFPSLFKRLYPHNFERALKSMTCVQIESIHIDALKITKKTKTLPRCHDNQSKSPKREKICLHAGQNISS